MAASNLYMHASDGATVVLNVPDGLGNSTRTISTGPNLSGITAYHLLKGDVTVSNTVITAGYGTYLYTGNTTTLPTVNLGMDITSQWGDSVNEKYGYLIIIKSRSAIGAWSYVDSVRGITKYIDSSSTAVEGTDANMFTLSTVGGITTVNIGTSTRTNTNAVTYVMEVYQTTHITTGTTNHGKAYTEHYNQVTGFTINGYAGSGLAGHELPHSLGRKLGFVNLKNLGTTDIFQTGTEKLGYAINSTNAFVDFTVNWTFSANSLIIGATGTTMNGLANNYILYGYRDSYIDESGKLIGNFEIGTYQGTGVAGNKVTTRGKPAWVMVKRLDSANNWIIIDNTRTANGRLYPNLSVVEDSSTIVSKFLHDGFTLEGNQEWNISGGQYLYMVVYDNDSGSGKSKYYKATDTSNLNINNAIIPFAQGIDGNGSKISTLSKNESITGLTLVAGKNYPYLKLDGTYGTTPYRPRYLKSDLVAEKAGDNPDYFDVTKNTWYNTLANPELVTNGTFDTVTTGWTAVNATLSVVNGNLSIANSTTSGGYAYTTIITIVGKRYRFKYNFSLGTSANANIQIGINANETSYANIVLTASKSDYIEFVANTTTTYITLYNNSTVSGQTSLWDNISTFATDLVINAEITSRTYLDNIAYADAGGQLTYVEALPKTQYFDRIETGSNRKVMYLADYGIAQIQVNKRYVLDNPFGNDRFMDCDTKLEIYDSGINKWIEIGHNSADTGTSATWYGAKSFSTIEGLVVQTALSFLTSSSTSAFVVPIAGTGNLTSAPARVTIQFNGKTGRTR